MGRFTVKGSVRDTAGNPIQGVKVFAMDSDQQLFEDHNDDMLGASWVQSNGTFEISSTPEQFQENVFEGKPDIYLIVRNSKGEVIHRTDIKKGLFFEIVLDSLEKKAEPAADPYANNQQRIFSAFANVGDTAAINNSDVARTFALLNSSMNAWVIYTRESTWEEIGYDGPQVPLYPGDTPHTHKLEWESNK